MKEKINNINGMTIEENEIAELIVETWNKFVNLEQTHPNDMNDFGNAIHQLQYILGMRTLRRLYPKYYPNKNIIKEQYYNKTQAQIEADKIYKDFLKRK